MQTLVLRIPDNLAMELEAEARRCHLSKSEVVRRRLLTRNPQDQEVATGFELIADLVGTVECGPSDMSTRKKHYLKSNGYGKVRHR